MNLIWSQAQNILFILIIILLIGYCINNLFIIVPTIIMFLFLYYFFRNPETIETKQDSHIIAPSYGTITKIKETQSHYKIITYLSPLDIHTQYSPILGKIVNQKYIEGTFHPAYLFQKSHLNERMIHQISSKHGNIFVTQIAGILARRIVKFKNIGDSVNSGTLLGLIKFGSRVDLVIPKTFKLKCKVGDSIIGGQTILADI